MFPHVNAQQGDKAGRGLERILISTCGNFQSLRGLVVTQPSPTTALDGHGFGRHVRLEGFQITKGFLDGRRRFGTGSSLFGREILPKQRVVLSG